jgi:DNA-binding NtrC family response regulator
MLSTDRTIPPPAPSPELARAFGHHAWDGCLRLRWTDTRGVRAITIEPSRPRCVLGSSTHVDVVVANPTVSRVHAEIEIDGRGAWVRDLGSSNGTFVDRVEVKSARIRIGQILRLGSAELGIEAVGLESTDSGIELWPEGQFGPLVGESVPMRELFATLARVAETDIPVLIRGETGSGKELVARAIHEASPRSKRPYVVVDCAALAENLLESELFGHARGAFTGATSAREGAIEAADGGTVFLDEIGELPLEMQPKLLRVLEQRTVRRVGESEYRPVDVRFISATHRDLVDFVARGWFREDLYFRLAVLPVRVPSLRERLEDIEPLVRRFLGPGAQALVTPRLLAELAGRAWRGNVRELRNVLDRARALGIERALSPDEPDSKPPPVSASGLLLAPPPALDTSVPEAMLELSHREFRDRWMEIGERAYLARKLAKHSGNVSKVSREIELARTYTHKLLKKHNL